MWFRNHYVCPRCDYEWVDEWSAQVDDELRHFLLRRFHPERLHLPIPPGELQLKIHPDKGHAGGSRISLREFLLAWADKGALEAVFAVANTHGPSHQGDDFRDTHDTPHKLRGELYFYAWRLRSGGVDN